MPEPDTKSIADRWSERARSGEWEKVLEEHDSYVNQDDSYEKFKRIIEDYLSSRQQTHILDIGCGSADLWDVLTKHVSQDQIYGIDIAEGMIEKARERYPEGNFFVGDAAELSKHIPQGIVFSSIVSRGVLVNHLGLDYFSQILDAAYPYLDDDGFLAFDYINKEWFVGREDTTKNKTLYTDRNMVLLIGGKGYSLLDIRNREGRDPIVILIK